MLRTAQLPMSQSPTYSVSPRQSQANSSDCLPALPSSFQRSPAILTHQKISPASLFLSHSYKVMPHKPESVSTEASVSSSLSASYQKSNLQPILPDSFSLSSRIEQGPTGHDPGGGNEPVVTRIGTCSAQEISRSNLAGEGCGRAIYTYSLDDNGQQAAPDHAVWILVSPIYKLTTCYKAKMECRPGYLVSILFIHSSVLSIRYFSYYRF